MHSKLKGNIGEAAVTLALNRIGCNVFREIGDLSKIDLIAQLDGHLHTIQVKAATPKNGVIDLLLKKSGPNYQFWYKKTDFDFFAIVNLDDLSIALISIKEMVDNDQKCLSLRIKPTQNNQRMGIRMFSSYIDILDILKKVSN